MSVENPLASDPQSNPAPTYFDPEALDTREQEFSASLESEPETARFVVDDSDNSAKPTAVQKAESSHDGPTLCEGTTGVGDLRSDETVHDESPDWRDQVSAKVNSYKSRSRHKPRYPSLQLQFDASSYRAQPRVDPGTPLPISFSQSVTAEIVALQPNPVSEAQPRITLEATARVIEFPRPAPPAFDPDELAESIIDRPRIVEAPELLPPAPAMGGILIEPPLQPDPERRAGLDMPLRSASLGRRIWAGSIDFLLLAIAVAAFGYVFVRITGALPPWRNSVQLAAMLLAFLWPSYQYAFTVFSKSTPGLRLGRLQIRRFDDSVPSRTLRRWRVLASFLSAASLGLGYAWCFLDEDQLSWHDRITKTHLAPVSADASSSTPCA